MDLHEITDRDLDDIWNNRRYDLGRLCDRLGVDRSMTRRIVLRLELSSALFTGADRLVALGGLMTQSAQAHGNQGWAVEQEGGLLIGSVWMDDVTLMNALRHEAAVARSWCAQEPANVEEGD